MVIPRVFFFNESQELGLKRKRSFNILKQNKVEIDRRNLDKLSILVDK